MARSNDPRFLSRRVVLKGAAVSAASLACPAISHAGERPLVTHGVQSGDVSLDGGMVWSRADRPARMLVDVSVTESFRNIRHSTFADALPETDFTAKCLLDELPPGEEHFYRVRFQNLHSPSVLSEPVVGRFRTAATTNAPVSFVWSGDVAGQGFGIDEARGGMRGFAALRRERPDFFIHCGDSVYADGPIERELVLPGGEIWRNIVTEEKSKVAETLAEYRGNYKYNLADRNVQACHAEVPTLVLWDDHEVVNDWYPGWMMRGDQYGQPSALMLAARGSRAFREFTPMRESLAEAGRIYRRIAYGPLLDVFLLDMRSYRGPTGDEHQGAVHAPGDLLGPAQLRWLKRELSASRATWKVIAASLPVGLKGTDGAAQGDGPVSGYEREIAELLSFMKRQRVRNTIWLAADVHYTAALHYEPGRAVFQDFDPFWEFVSGPLHAGTWRPDQADNTFGARIVYANGSSDELGDGVAPSAGLQFFGHVAIDGSSGAMTVTLKDIANRSLWSVVLEPEIDRWSGMPGFRQLRMWTKTRTSWSRSPRRPPSP